mmetsp:Transcript_26318/g.46717  ORF Transcript_26318/g.46717 Transcript_26318/m.46717 type:complete len:199 (-) Transcript_26318:21-617(-)
MDNKQLFLKKSTKSLHEHPWRGSSEIIPSEIVKGRLWLGCANCAKAAGNADNSVGITHILNVSDEVSVSPPTGETSSGVVTLMVPIDDNGKSEIFISSPDGIWSRCRSFLVDAHSDKKSRVLIACTMGVNRSATIVTAWLMDQRRWTRDEALEFVRECRPQVEPVTNYLEQLHAFEEILKTQKPLDDSGSAGCTCSLL